MQVPTPTVVQTATTPIAQAIIASGQPNDGQLWMTAIGAVLSPLVAAIAVYYTVRILQENQRLTRAAITQAELAGKQVDTASAQLGVARRTLERNERDQELAWAPYLAYHPGVGMRNIGRGPALSCCEVTLAQDPIGHDVWNATELFDLAPGDVKGQRTSYTGDEIEKVAVRVLGDLKKYRFSHRDQLLIAYVCEDQFGNKYRFRYRGGRPDIWHLGDPEPGWTDWYWEPNT